MQPTIPPYQCHNLMPFGYVPHELLETVFADEEPVAARQSGESTVAQQGKGNKITRLATVSFFLFTVAALATSTALLVQAFTSTTAQVQEHPLETLSYWDF